jgi:serine/threonine protein kinase
LTIEGFVGLFRAIPLILPEETVNREIERVLFEAAMDLADPEERREFLERACKEESALRARLDKLLALRPVAERFFDDSLQGAPGSATSNGSTAVDGDVVATRIGRYKLLERIGEGGCGVVYLAEQQEPVRRGVALKIIRLGMDTESVIARFEAERQALALMDHPNIARVLDAGATDSGRPYFVMELVRGVRVTDYCRENHLSTRERLEIFIRICHAIQHAHQKGIIHRDIKPSNILVSDHDGTPAPKVIDFGIAKATEDPLNSDAAITLSGQFLGTPAYMSPEQVGMIGLDVDTRSDIYSLGVLLYELLTGRTPFDNKRLVEAGVDEMRRTLVEKEPLLPSAMVTTLGQEPGDTSGQASADARKLASELRGDLDWIVMKALEKDRQRRYQTASALAADVHRHLADEVVTARPPSRTYRFQKLVRRNKIAFAGVVALALTLMTGLGTSTWLYVRERQASREQQRLRGIAERGQREAGAREKAMAAVAYLAKDDFTTADQLVAQIPDELMPSSLESVELVRALGIWHTRRAEWRMAADRYVTLQRIVAPLESPDSPRASRDLIPAAVLLMECGDLGAYERCRAGALQRFGRAKNAEVAERVLKCSLLAPADETFLRKLEPLAEVATNYVGAEHSVPKLTAWIVVARGLHEYRRGNFAEAVGWTNRYSAYDRQNPARSALAHCVLAMSYHRLNEPGSAVEQLKRTRELIDPRFHPVLRINTDSEGYAEDHDWLVARLLQREAIALIEPER